MNNLHLNKKWKWIEKWKLTQFYYICVKFHYFIKKMKLFSQWIIDLGGFAMNSLFIEWLSIRVDI